jgi:hypothetical protein
MTKKLLALSALLLTSLLTTAVFQKKADAYQFRAISQDTDAGRHAQLLWVRNSESSTAFANGDVIAWYDGTVADGLETKLVAAADSRTVAGVAIGAVAAGSWGFIQTHGYHSAIKIEVANSAFDALSSGSAAGKAKVDNTAGMDNFGIALEATTSSTTVKGFIRL